MPSAFKAARFFSPSDQHQLTLTHWNLSHSLKIVWQYQAAVEDVSQEVDTIKWWKDNQNESPAWAEACKLVLLVQLSPAPAERVFSLLENFFFLPNHCP